ncbi:hypothetical protein [Mesobacillus jeotgali]|uniref:hypothetical protein n=1 Tax=Mesobacillus jeotgali TaxID=129985 RepID=UPI001CFEBE1B|nr:hypothetical protein [Mesobacillus jeotgali]
MEKLSRKARNRDRFARKSGKVVKKSSELRQVRPEKWKSCQEKLGIVTGSPGKVEKLSRKARNHDRFGCESGKAVKKSPELRQVRREKWKSCQEKLGIVTGNSPDIKGKMLIALP